MHILGPPRRSGKSLPGARLGKGCLIAFLVAGVLALAVEAAGPGPAKPSLLVVTIDTLRADHIGAYGYAPARTPVIDGLARRGIRFARAFSHVPLTLPSHCTLFTGLLPVSHGVRDNGQPLGPGPRTLAEIARSRGLATAAVVGAFPLDSRFGLDRGYETYNDLYGSRNRVRDMAFVERRGRDVSDAAAEWLRARGKQPFFLWVHYFDPHAPYDPPPPYDREFAGREYDGEIAYADECVGRLLKALEEAGRAGDTLVVLAADHGEGLGAHEEKTHGIFIYDTTLHVPLIMAGAGVAARGRVVEAPVGLSDVLPTITELMGWPAPDGLAGRSLTSLMNRPDEDPRKAGRALYLESLNPLLSRNWAPLRGVRTSEWKYIDAPQPELYDVKSDPGEEENVFGAHPAVVRRLRGEMEALLGRQAAAASHQGPALDRESRQKLLSLGYIGSGAGPGGAPGPNPKSMIAWDNLLSDAVNASETGRLEEAAAIYKDILRQQPDYIVAYDYAAYNLTKMGRGGEAIRLLEKAVGRGLGTDKILAHLGLYYQEDGRLEDSIATLEKVLTLNADVAEVHNDLGVSLFKSGRLDEAAAAFQKSLALDPHYAMALNNLGNCRLALKRYGEAEADYRAAIDLDENLASSHNGLAAVLYRQGRVEEALKAWARALEIDPRQTEALYNLGRITLRLGRKEEALRYFELYVASASPQREAKDIEEVKGVIARLKKEIRRP